MLRLVRTEVAVQTHQRLVLITLSNTQDNQNVTMVNGWLLLVY